MSSSESNLVINPYDLPTFQRHLRHLRSISLRNLQCSIGRKKDVNQLKVYFTLHVDRKLKEFYKSEEIRGSLHPSWKSFDLSQFEDEIDIQLKYFVVRIWVRNSAHKDSIPYLLVDWYISLSGLVFFSDQLHSDKYRVVPNMVVVGMFDKYFIAPEKPLSPFQDEMLVLTDPPSSVKKSYSVNSLMRVRTVLRAISQMQSSVKRVHKSIEDKLLLSKEKAKKLSAKEDLQIRVSLMKSELSWLMNKFQQQREISENCHKTNVEKHEVLKERFRQLEYNIMNLEDKRKFYFETREKYIKENYHLLIKRKQLICELATCIYPIELFGKQLCICGVYLPDAEDIQSHDETMCAVALGYVCHLVLMMSRILDFPLRYKIVHIGSRSTIIDHIHPNLKEKDQLFPLYPKGKIKFYFNYGVFLLNKNISQLRYYCGLGTADLRPILQNLKSMLETRLGVSSDRSSILHPKLDFTDIASTPLTKGNELLSSSLASGGKDGSHIEEEVFINKDVNYTRECEMNSTNVNKEKLPDVQLMELSNIDQGNIDTDKDSFNSNEETFLRLQRQFTEFELDSAENSICGSFPDNMINYGNFSLSPSPGTAENSLPSQTHSNLSSSKISLHTFNFGEGTHEHSESSSNEIYVKRENRDISVDAHGVIL